VSGFCTGKRQRYRNAVHLRKMPLSPYQASGIFFALELQHGAARSPDAIRERFFRCQIAPGFHPGYKKMLLAWRT
jgi:hypothetical protein